MNVLEQMDKMRKYYNTQGEIECLKRQVRTMEKRIKYLEAAKDDYFAAMMDSFRPDGGADAEG